MRFYSKCNVSGVDVLARRFRLASNRYIVRKSAKIKVCPYQVMVYLMKLVSNVFFLKHFVINYVLNFVYEMFNEKSFNEKFLLTRNI